jgi:Subtilase family
MADHLLLPVPVRLDSRRAGGGGGTPHPRSPGAHGRKLTEELNAAISAQRPVRTIEGVDPSCVFKLRATGELKDSALNSNELQFLGDTSDWTYFVLVAGEDPVKLRASLQSYAAAGEDRSNALGRSFFEAIEELLPYDREDRRGPGLPASGTQLDGPLLIDVILWPSPDLATARGRIGDVRTVIDAHSDAQVLIADDRARFTVVRARVGGNCLDDLLDLSVVELIRVPPAPRLEPSTWRHIQLQDLPDPTSERFAPIGLIDDEVMNHPLLTDAIASRDAIPAQHSWAPPSDHATLVAGLLAYGSVEDSLAGSKPWVASGPIHCVRVLEPVSGSEERTRFPTDQPVHLVVEEAIRGLHERHGVRIFNLSITDDDPYSGPLVSVWSERMDELARELDIVIVIAAGNHRPSDLPVNTDILNAYPSYLLGDAARIAEPGIAVNAITVGSVAHSDTPQRLDGQSRPGERAIAAVRQPSPFTRSGPGPADATKPDLVHNGGNWTLNDVDVLQERDHGVSVISLVVRDQRLFGVANGTSFAAPRVARLAAQILHRYPEASANLIRALVGSACVPVASPAVLDRKELRRLAGNGRPIEANALDSHRQRISMIFEGDIVADTATIHPVPIPEEFARGGSWRRITVALAFDPSVRRTRREYLASSMSFDLVRAMTIEEVSATWQSQPKDKAQRLKLPGQHQRPKLQPGTQECDDSTLQVRSLRTKRLDVDDGDTYFVVVQHASSPWISEQQRYALVVTLEDEEREEIDLYAAVQPRARVRTRIRLRG